MPITTSGRDVQLVRNPRGKFDFVQAADGNPARSEAEDFAVLTQILDERGSEGIAGWIFDESGRHGSRLYLLKEDGPSQRSHARGEVEDALQVLVEDGRLTVFTVRIEGELGAPELVVTYQTPSTQPESVEKRIAISPGY